MRGVAALRPPRIWRIGSPIGAPDLTRMHKLSILMHMRTTLNIDDELMEKARRLSGFKEKTAIVHAGLEALIALESARRLAALGGSESKLRPARRRRSKKAS